MESDKDYWARRAEEERAAAEKATDAWVRDVHLQLAEAYGRRAGGVASIAPVHRTGGRGLTTPEPSGRG